MKSDFKLTSDIKLVGTFVFRDDGDGCLTSKYINVGLDSPLVEAAKRISNPTPEVKFTGEYSSIWLDDIYVPKAATLTISLSSNDYYILRWTTTNGNLTFEGQGMIIQDLLVGSFWQ